MQCATCAAQPCSAAVRTGLLLLSDATDDADVVRDGLRAVLGLVQLVGVGLETLVGLVGSSPSESDPSSWSLPAPDDIVRHDAMLVSYSSSPTPALHTLYSSGPRLTGTGSSPPTGSY